MTAHAIPTGDAGVRATARAMEQLAKGNEGALNPYIIRYAQLSVAHAPSKDQTAEAHAVRDAISSTVRFVNESGERLQTPVITLGWDGSRFDPYAAAGDCDCQTTLLMACLTALGIESRLLIVSTSPNRQFSHVLLIARDKRRGTWFPLDCTRNTNNLQHVTRAAVYDYGKLNELATSQWAKPSDVTSMIYDKGAILASTYANGVQMGMGDYPAYRGRAGRATFGDSSTAADITNLLLPISEGAGLALAHANTQAVLVGGANIGPLNSTGVPNMASISGSPLGTLSGQVPSWLVIGGILIGVLFIFKK